MIESSSLIVNRISKYRDIKDVDRILYTPKFKEMLAKQQMATLEGGGNGTPGGGGIQPNQGGMGPTQ